MMKIYSKVMLTRLELKGLKKKTCGLNGCSGYAVGMYEPVD